MKGFSNRWKDFPDYIIGITKEIWEDRGVGTLHHYYAKDIVVRSPMGIQRGNQQVIASTMATINEFPDRQLFGDDVIWSEHETGYLSSHRLNTVATHTRDGAFGHATGKRWNVKVIADCAALEDTSSTNGSCATMAAWCGNLASHLRPMPLISSPMKAVPKTQNAPSRQTKASTAATTDAATTMNGANATPTA